MKDIIGENSILEFSSFSIPTDSSCMESPFEKIPGVIEVNAGYTGGETKNPSYEEVSSGRTGHFEAVEVVYDPHEVSFKEVLAVFWQQIDPTDEAASSAIGAASVVLPAFFTINIESIC